MRVGPFFGGGVGGQEFVFATFFVMPVCGVLGTNYGIRLAFGPVT